MIKIISLIVVSTLVSLPPIPSAPPNPKPPPKPPTQRDIKYQNVKYQTIPLFDVKIIAIPVLVIAQADAMAGGQRVRARIFYEHRDAVKKIIEIA